MRAYELRLSPPKRPPALIFSYVCTKLTVFWRSFTLGHKNRQFILFFCQQVQNRFRVVSIFFSFSYFKT